MKELEYKLEERRKQWEYVYGCSTATIFDRLTFGRLSPQVGTQSHGPAGVVFGFQVKSKENEKDSSYQKVIFYLCSNTVNCGVKTAATLCL